MHTLSFDIVYFLEQREWEIYDETENFLYLSPPESIVFEGNYLIKLPKENISEDFYLIIDNLLTKLRIIYGDKYSRTFKKFLSINQNSKRKYLSKNEWITTEDRSKIDKIGSYEIYVPNKKGL